MNFRFNYKIPYPLEYNHGVVFFNMSFWVRFNSKNLQKVDFLTKKWGSIHEKTHWLMSGHDHVLCDKRTVKEIFGLFLLLNE